MYIYWIPNSNINLCSLTCMEVGTLKKSMCINRWAFSAPTDFGFPTCHCVVLSTLQMGTQMMVLVSIFLVFYKERVMN